MKRAINNFAGGSGPDGFRPQFFKGLISIFAGNVGFDFLTETAELINFMLRGEDNEVIFKFMDGASLCAIGLAIRRLSSKTVDPREFISVESRWEAAVHATRSFVTASRESCRVTQKINYSNAYNTVPRDFVLASVKDHTPFLYNYFRQSYDCPTRS